MDGLLGAAEAFSWTSIASWLAIFKVVIGLGAVIFVHEMGHFLVAKACGVKCEKFYLGFDAFDIRIGDLVLIPRKLVSFQWGETEYGIGIIPLGGYVKMLGQDDNPANAARERERSMQRVEQTAGDDAEGEETSADRAEESPSESQEAPGHEEAYALDPRSYQAKSVPQRMAIISAGVIMNLIFAVIFAAVAFMIGAPYEPCTIGSVVPSGPAWVKDVQPGAEVVQIGENGERREHLRFSRDLVSAIAYNGDQQDIHLFLETPRSDEVREVSLRPRTDLMELKGALLPQVGIGPTSSLEFGDPAVLPGSAAAAAGFETGDRIVGLKIGDETWSELDFAMLKRQLARHPDRPVTFVIERSAEGSEAETLDVKVGTNPMRFVGLHMEYSPIVAVQEGSPAEQAGLQVGDELVSLDGQPIGDPLTLEDRLLTVAREGRTVPVVIGRTQDGESREVTLEVTPREPRTRYNTIGELPIAIDELGICLKVKNVVGSAEPGSSAAKAGLAAGDQIVAVQWVPANPSQREIETEIGFSHAETDLQDAPFAWPIIFAEMQQRLSDTKMKVTYERDGQTQTAELDLAVSDEFFQRSRGMYLSRLEKEHQADSIGEAFALGFRETKENALLVFSFLKKLATQEISPINLGGPGTIAASATHEAMFGTARLLLFLTLLSANLAVVNFLPIPVLDGGHMVFLTWEAIFRKPLSEKVMVTLSMAGLLFIVGLMLFVISLDIYRFLPG